MDTSYLSQQVTTIIERLHGFFDEIGVPSHERDSRESEVTKLRRASRYEQQADHVYSCSLLSRRHCTTNSTSSRKKSMISQKKRSVSSNSSDRWNAHWTIRDRMARKRMRTMA